MGLLMEKSQTKERTFIDLFSGCGGLSLGLMKAGWKGIFAIEKTESAFKTLQHNLIAGPHYQYNWPTWLPQQNMEVGSLIENYRSQLKALNGTVDLIAGGPPCQGFSHAGKRNPNDPRNKLAEQYIEVVELVKPKYLLLENVRGFNAKFLKEKGQDSIPYSQVVKERLEALGYGVAFKIIKSSEWGIPQHRPRFILLAKLGVSSDNFDPFLELESFREKFLVSKDLPLSGKTSVRDAIFDLEVNGKNLIANTDSGMKGFFEIDFNEDPNPSNYIKLLREGAKGSRPDGLRLPRHSQEVKSRFQVILDRCPRGITISKKLKQEFSIRKQAITPLCPKSPSATVTTLPDDIIHYSEPRILTVRENARLQSFPDWFSFRGPYTTGGKLRKHSCPRYTQVGNAVPPLLAEAMGRLLFDQDKVLE